MNDEQITSVVVTIDTTSYAGNFEREMCAFITGQIGDCGVGGEFVAEANEELALDTFNVAHQWIKSHIVNESDEHGIRRPCSIWSTPGWFNNGMGGHYRDVPEVEEQALKDNYEALVNYHASQLSMINSRIEKNDFEDSSKPGAWDKDACIRTKQRIENVLSEAKAKSKVTKHPAYLSVAIFFDEIPPEEVMEVLIQRAKRFAKERPDQSFYQREKKPLTMTNVRVLAPSLIKQNQIDHLEVKQYRVYHETF